MRFVGTRPVRLLLAVGTPVLVLLLVSFALQASTRPAQAEVRAVAYQPPAPANLSIVGAEYSASADIDANQDAIVVAWTEGNLQTGATNPNGNVELKWKWGSGDWLRLTVWRYTGSNDKAYDEAVVLRGDVAHLVWVVRSPTSPANYAVYYLAWNVRLNWCAKQPGLAVDGCREQVSQSNEDAKTQPRVAVDANGVPHVVWMEQLGGSAWHIFYDNRNGVAWYTPGVGGTDKMISSLGSGQHLYEYTHPVIAADDRYVYVAWDLNDRLGTPYCWQDQSGIQFRLRKAITGTAYAADVAWDPGVLGQAKRLSVVAGGGCNETLEDGWPTIDVSDHKAYVMWQHLTDGASLGGGAYNVYTYTLRYRVLTGANVAQDWWPSADPNLAPDSLPWDVTSLYSDTLENAYMSGVRPALQLTKGQQGIGVHVVWQQWTPPSGGDEPVLVAPYASGQVGPLAGEGYVTQDWPYQVLYASATYNPPDDLDTVTWITRPITVPVGRADRILCWPDLALASYDGGQSYYLHLAVHRQMSDSGLQNVWYTNLDYFEWTYLPVVTRRHSRR